MSCMCSGGKIKWQPGVKSCTINYVPAWHSILITFHVSLFKRASDRNHFLRETDKWLVRRHQEHLRCCLRCISRDDEILSLNSKTQIQQQQDFHASDVHITAGVYYIGDTSQEKSRQAERARVLFYVAGDNIRTSYFLWHCGLLFVCAVRAVFIYLLALTINDVHARILRRENLMCYCLWLMPAYYFPQLITSLFSSWEALREKYQHLARVNCSLFFSLKF